MAKYRKRKLYPKDIGKRFCKTCREITYFKWSDSQNTYICERCEYEKALYTDGLLKSEDAFIVALEMLKEEISNNIASKTTKD